MDTRTQEICGLSQSVWMQMLGLDLKPCPATAPSASPGSLVEGHVHISGQWRGVLVLQCTAAAAETAAQKIFGLGDAAPSADDVRDALGELTNMIGGNTKALLSDEGCFLSLPVVVQGRDYAVHIPGAHVVARQEFMSERQFVAVTLFEHVHGTPARAL